MKTATVRQVRHDFGRVLDWVNEGEPVQITKRGKVVAVMQPPAPKKAGKVLWPDILARLNSYCGDFVLSDEAYERMREAQERKL